MADHDKDRFYRLANFAIAAFEYIQAILSDLPIPVAVPDFDPAAEDGNAAETLYSLDRARTLIADEPIPDSTKGGLERMILDWLTAYEIIALTKVAGPAPWRFEIAEYALQRIHVMSELLDEGEPDDDSPDDNQP
ncbi:hypothetical protein QFW82_23585 [Streptomyces malaysiensis subsp. malaysiensis]|uniref:hypothetical protein n=1 Tax=Streptomyces malaysiensis TaxID=92644 RepID=UPI0024C085BA|nr:hypothetical protein [Streptomyces sp. NA07423]WHX19814.1 hypothetical protein QFW82_23585 [Streptomyces sp. NA07423]